MTSAFLGESAEKRMVGLHWDLLEPVTKHSEVREFREAALVENAGYFAEKIDRLAVGFLEFDSQGLQCEHCPLGEPAAPQRGGGFVWISDNSFSFRDCGTGEETELGYQSNPSLHLLPQ